MVPRETPLSIWQYSEQRDSTVARALASVKNCVFCEVLLLRDSQDETEASTYEEMNYGLSDNFQTTANAVIGVCPICGWWKFGLTTLVGGSRAREPFYEVRLGSLKRFDLAASDAPAEEVRSYLHARYDARTTVHPKVFEEVVASVFRDHGFVARVTAYSGDGGIDVVLEGKAGETIGVQVKRYRNAIAVDQIRELTGALVIGGHTKGIFVTTSVFQAGASKTASLSELRGYPIELVDAERFYEMMKIGRLLSPKQVTETKPWGAVPRWGT